MRHVHVFFKHMLIESKNLGQRQQKVGIVELGNGSVTCLGIKPASRTG